MKIKIGIIIGLVAAALVTLFLVVQHQATEGLKKIAQDFQLSLRAFGDLEYLDLKVSVLNPSATFTGVTFNAIERSGVIKADFIRIENMSLFEVYRLVYHDEYPPSMTIIGQNLRVPFTQLLKGSEFIKNLEIDGRPVDFKLKYEYSLAEHKIHIQNIDTQMRDVFDLRSEFELSHVPVISATIFKELKTESQRVAWQKKFLNSHLDGAVLKLRNSKLTERAQSAFKKTYGLDLLSVFKTAKGLLGLLNLDKGEKNLSYMLDFFEKPQSYVLTAQSKSSVTLAELYNPKLWLALPSHYNLKVEEHK